MKTCEEGTVGFDMRVINIIIAKWPQNEIIRASWGKMRLRGTRKEGIYNAELLGLI